MSDQSRPAIGINMDLIADPKTNFEQTRLDAGYIDAIYSAGGMPVPVPPLGKEAEIDAMLDSVAGVVLTGGLDMDPKRLGQDSHAAVRAMSERRENHDRILVRKIVERRVPVLAIGLGMQQLNAALGGSLFLHLPSDCPKALPHYDPSGGPHRHLAMVEPKTMLEEIYGTNELRVNSTHHQAIKDLGRGLRVCAKSPDDVVEAFEWAGTDWFCLGVQWHPEADTASALDLQMFECFIQASVRASQPLSIAA